MKWYVVHTYSGHENKVKSYLRPAKENIDVGDKIGRVIVPTEEVVEMKDGRKTTSLKKFYPVIFWLNWIWTKSLSILLPVCRV